MNRLLAGLLLAAVLSMGCTVNRVAGPLSSDRLVDAYAVPPKALLAVRRTPSDEEVSKAIHLVLQGRLADLGGDCARGQELLEAAAEAAPTDALADARKDHGRRCLEQPGDAAEQSAALASR
jgi:hypothetical protein